MVLLSLIKDENIQSIQTSVQRSLLISSHLHSLPWKLKEALHLFFLCVAVVFRGESCILCFYCWTESPCCVYSKIVHFLSLLLQLKYTLSSYLKAQMYDGTNVESLSFFYQSVYFCRVIAIENKVVFIHFWCQTLVFFVAVLEHGVVIFFPRLFPCFLPPKTSVKNIKISPGCCQEIQSRLTCD